MTMSHYDEVLQEARQRGELIANKYIFELYTILRDEEHLAPEDCRAKIQHDCIDIWSKATIRKFLPEEAKNPKKSKAGKIVTAIASLTPDKRCFQDSIRER